MEDCGKLLHQLLTTSGEKLFGRLLHHFQFRFVQELWKTSFLRTWRGNLGHFGGSDFLPKLTPLGRPSKTHYSLKGEQGPGLTCFKLSGCAVWSPTVAAALWPPQSKKFVRSWKKPPPAKPNLITAQSIDKYIHTHVGILTTTFGGETQKKTQISVCIWFIVLWTIASDKNIHPVCIKNFMHICMHKNACAFAAFALAMPPKDDDIENSKNKDNCISHLSIGQSTPAK